MMDEHDDAVGEIVPPHVPLIPRPEILETAIGHLEIATSEFNLALQRFHIWRVLAYDSRVVERLGKGFATGGFSTVRGAIFESLLITLTRMFDQGVRGKRPLSLKNVCGDICHPEGRAFIVQLRSADALDFPARLGLVCPLGDEDRAAFEISAKAEAVKMQQKAEGSFDALVRLGKALKKPRIRNALERLQELRNTEIAHRDLEPAATPTLARPTYRDLDTLFGAAAVLIRRMNLLSRNLDINYTDFSYRAHLRALAFSVGLRTETVEERRAFSKEIRGREPE